MNKLLSTLTGIQVDTPKSVIDQGFVGKSPETAGCLIKTNLVHSICNGIIIDAGIDPNNITWSITVAVNSQKWVRYCRLVIDEVPHTGSKVKTGELIGVAYKGLMRF